MLINLALRCVHSFVGVTKNKSGGNTTSDAVSARKIIIAVSCPYEENIGIGANPIMAKPTMLDVADATKATPVPRDACRKAVNLSGLLLSSSLNRSVIWME